MANDVWKDIKLIYLILNIIIKGRNIIYFCQYKQDKFEYSNIAFQYHMTGKI